MHAFACVTVTRRREAILSPGGVNGRPESIPRVGVEIFRARERSII